VSQAARLELAAPWISSILGFRACWVRLTDPYAMYARVRGPVTWNEQMGLWLVTRNDDVRWALGEPRL
jgi:hypothetical protein